jgi:hypothetical protein
VKLYELTAELMPLKAALEAADVDEDGVAAVPPDMLVALDALELEYTDKIHGCAKWVRSLEAEADMVLAEAERLRQRAKRLAEQAERLQDAMRRSLIATGTHCIKGQLFTVSLRRGSTRVDVTDDNALPTAFRRVVPETWVPDKKAIGAALKAGADVPGAVLAQGEPTLTIK